MSRGLQLACEQCDFTATLRERAPFGLDATGEMSEKPLDTTHPEGYWQDELCGECRLPVRIAHYHTDGISGDGAERSPGACPRCGGTTMPFEDALRELAEACHSRVRVDLLVENTARARIERAVALSSELIDALARGDTTTIAAIDALLRSLVDDGPDTIAARASSAATLLSATHTLGGLDSEIENATSLEGARDILRARLDDSEGYIRGLEACVEDEAHLPGVPCPQCETGRLIHWPFWT